MKGPYTVTVAVMAMMVIMAGAILPCSAADAEDNGIFDPSDANTREGYIRSTGVIGGLDSTSNHIVLIPIEGNTEYTVTMDADVRFRMGTVTASEMANDLTVRDFYMSPLDDNESAVIGHVEHTFTSSEDVDTLVIQYHSTTGTQSASSILATLSVTTSGTTEPVDPTETTEPTDPVNPTDPIDPADPTDPDTPDIPSGETSEEDDDDTAGLIVGSLVIIAVLVMLVLFLSRVVL